MSTNDFSSPHAGLRRTFQQIDQAYCNVIRDVCGGIFEIANAQDCRRCDLQQCLSSDYSRALLGSDASRRIALLHDTYRELSEELDAALQSGNEVPEAPQLLAELENLTRQIIALMKLARNRRS